jgi:hypothetical protein
VLKAGLDDREFGVRRAALEALLVCTTVVDDEKARRGQLLPIFSALCSDPPADLSSVVAHRVGALLHSLCVAPGAGALLKRADTDAFYRCVPPRSLHYVSHV